MEARSEDFYSKNLVLQRRKNVATKEAYKVKKGRKTVSSILNNILFEESIYQM